MPTPAELQQVLDQLRTDLTELEGVQDGCITLMTQLSQRLKDALGSGGTPQDKLDQIAAISAELDQRKDALAAAIVANTVAEDEPPPAEGGGGETPPPDTGGGETPPTP